MVVLQIRDIHFDYSNERTLLESVSFNLKAGEVVVLFGLNGTGKSTLLRIISGLQMANSGTVAIVNLDNAATSESIGYVMQNPENSLLAPTVEEEIALGMELRGYDLARMHSEVERSLTRFELTELRERSPESLSGGEKQRVALAAILTLKPRFLLLDEPDSLLDASSIRRFRAMIDSIKTEHGILWSCADAEQLPNADRYFRLKDGSMIVTTREEIMRFTAAEESAGCEA